MLIVHHQGGFLQSSNVLTTSTFSVFTGILNLQPSEHLLFQHSTAQHSTAQHVFIEIFIDRHRTTLRSQVQALAACAPIQAANSFGFLVCMNTVPGPENLQTSPSPLLMPEIIPPLATRSITYLQFQATRWPLSMMYFSPSTSCDLYQ